jgi:hypothetical protein
VQLLRVYYRNLHEGDAVFQIARESGCALPRELAELYGWRNGMHSDTDVPFTLYHRFVSLQDALDRRDTYRNPVFRLGSPLPEDWIPVLEFQGEYYFIRCDTVGTSAAVVWYWSGEEPEIHRVFASLTGLLETAADWYESGAIRVADPTGGLDMDVRRVRDIYVRRYPDLTFPYYVDDN